ncbi:MAG: 16S rRNA (cytidine(1402)-2'-O)-methyltransferase [Halieaceae bacterium]|nr:16S rRNA (cytidine(1402)-2'-O)-methyltransferase [Halieaceae bacterium]
MESGLYVVATPIGNFGDMSQRAVDVLREVDLIAAEDTRHSRRLLQHFGIETPLMAYHDHSDERALRRIIGCFEADESVALVSDAGTPLVSDPGYRLVRCVQDEGHKVFPIPGACAAVAALSATGLPTDRFLFEGFLPAKRGARENRLRALRTESATLIFYEAPHRIVDTLEALVGVFGPVREAALAREVTKLYETIRRLPLSALAQFVREDNNQQKGEIVLLVAGASARESQLDTDVASLLVRLAQELPAKRAAAVVAEHTGLRKKQLYDYLLSLK